MDQDKHSLMEIDGWSKSCMNREKSDYLHPGQTQ